MLAGETPFTGKVIGIDKVAHTVEPQSIREKNRKVPKRMARVVMSARQRTQQSDHRQRQGSHRIKGGAEGEFITRQSISLYSERFPIFLKYRCWPTRRLSSCAPESFGAKLIMRKYLADNAILLILSRYW